MLTHWGRDIMAAIFPTFSNAFSWIKMRKKSIKISLKFVPKIPINYIPTSVQIMAWCRPGDKPLSGIYDRLTKYASKWFFFFFFFWGGGGGGGGGCLKYIHSYNKLGSWWWHFGIHCLVQSNRWKRLKAKIRISHYSISIYHRFTI